MKFEEFREDILKHTNTVGGTQDNVLSSNTKETDTVLVAAAQVMSKNGVTWCKQNPERFTAAVGAEAKSWWQYLLPFLGFLFPGGSILSTIIQMLIPIILNYLTDLPTVSATVSSCDELGDTAKKWAKKHRK